MKTMPARSAILSISRLPKMIQPRRNVSLAEFTTMHVGGLADYFIEAMTIQDVKAAIAWARDMRVPLLVMGGGSNVIVGSDGFRGLVLRLKNQRYSMSSGNHEVVSGAAAMMEELVTQTTEKGWQGLEWAGGLPGTLGGAVRGNAGCFGGEIRNVVRSVTTIDPQTGQVRVWDNEACEFGYRTSAFKHNGQIIWEVRLRLGPGDREELVRCRDEKIAYRAAHHPHEPSAGSIFQNLYVKDLPANFFDRFPDLLPKVRGEKLAAGALFDLLGLRGKQIGGAKISDEHGNFVINTGAASADDVRSLIAVMKDAARNHYGIELHEEPELI